MSLPEPGLEILPGLTLLRRLGQGGMGEAWLARDAARGADVVAKILPQDAPPERLALLRREARLVRKLRHPGIVPVLGFQSGERFCAVTMRFVPGGDALRLRGRAPVEIARLGRDVADALSYLHGLGVVHRDVKTSNVLLDASGRAQLADFGIAAVAQDVAQDEDGIVVRGGGSRASMSPQQRAGEPPAAADDLYALGVLLLELLTGQQPAEGDAAASATELWRLDLPERLRGLVASLVAPSPEARPRSAAAARDELDAVLAELSRASATAEARAVRLQPPPRAADRGQNESGPELFVSRPANAASPVSAKVLFLGALVMLAIGAAVWLPSWARGPEASTPAPSPESPAPAATAAPQPEAAAAAAAPGLAEEPEPPPSDRTAAAPQRPPAAGPSQAEGLAASSHRARAAQPERVAPAGEKPAPSAGEPAAAEPEPANEPDRAAEARALAGHRDQGSGFEAREDWRAAQKEYEAALAIDPHVTFAIEGRERAQKRAALDESLDAHAKRPDRLTAPAVAREAEALLERARSVEPVSPELQRRVQAVEAALASARRPVAVVIESDGLTELTLSRVGALGTLKRRRIELLPGSYTVTGSRRGYRDVRRQFSVSAGAPAPVVSLRCEESL